MKTRLYPIAPTAAQRLAIVRGISEGTAPTGRKLFTVPAKPFTVAPAAPAAQWFAKSTNAQELAALNLIARYPVAPVASTQ